MIDLLIISDDLTGAIETGAQFSKKGVPTIITIDVNIDFTALPSNIEVVVIDTESRYIDPSVASTIIKDICDNAKKVGVHHIYKKTDSTLRGNVGIELDALLEKLDYNPLCFIPAYPKLKRYTRKGYQYVEENLLHNSIIAANPMYPISLSYVPDILRRQTRIKTKVIQLKHLGKEKLFKQKYKRILIFDTETTSDLRNIGNLLKENDALHLVAGPAGFAELLPELLQLRGETMPYIKNNKPVLIVNGSMNKTSFEQTEFACANGYHQMLIPQEILINKEDIPSENVTLFINSLIKKASEGKNIVLQTIKSRSLLHAYFTQAGVKEGVVDIIHERAVVNIARLTRLAMQSKIFGNLIVIGNDTTRQVMKSLNIKALHPRTEIVPGLCYSNVDGDFGDIIFIEKPGGFGEIDTIMKLTNFLTTFK
ncbi:MAG: hypothetical protein JXB49_00815 [Bacteroidales bacterium]|nr:hypothetical protein [Bacteroidales bacterium]